ncbi:hypothetical protein SPONN_110 [uncultured Candidatus Thioglobus sp.]|nr:hypothetical protein SPONN_110 [uncultured Candidatus Thioglobus sp.]
MEHHTDDWGQYLDAAVFAINTSIQASTKVTPFCMMFGRAARLPLEAEKQGEGCDIDEVMESICEANQASFFQALVEKQKQIFQLAEENINKAQKKQIDQYRKRKGIIEYNFTDGDRILRRNMKQKTRKGSKSEDRWLGPYTIMALSKTSCILVNASGRRLKTRVNLNQLKPYMQNVDSHQSESSRMHACFTSNCYYCNYYR